MRSIACADSPVYAVRTPAGLLALGSFYVSYNCVERLQGVGAHLQTVLPDGCFHFRHVKDYDAAVRCRATARDYAATVPERDPLFGCFEQSGQIASGDTWGNTHHLCVPYVASTSNNSILVA